MNRYWAWHLYIFNLLYEKILLDFTVFFIHSKLHEDWKVFKFYGRICS